MEDDAVVADPFTRRGFEGPADIAAAAKIAHEAMMGAVPPPIGAIAPPPGEPPRAWNKSGTRAMYAVWVRAGVTLPVPDGMDEADESLVGALVSA